MLTSIKTSEAPKAVGPYSQGVRAGNFVFVSGQLPLDPKTGKLITGGIIEQATCALNNVGAVLSAAGLTFTDVVKATVFLTDIGNFAEVNDIYGGYFQGEVLPARCAIEVAKLPKDASIEIEVIAYCPEG